MINHHKKSGSGMPRSAGVSKKSKPFTFNTIMFEKSDGSPIPYDNANGGSVVNFKKMASLSRGDFRALKGLKSIQSAASDENS